MDSDRPPVAASLFGFLLADTVDETGLSFDYRIQEGVVATRNATRLLELIGYPDDVTGAAMEPFEPKEQGLSGLRGPTLLVASKQNLAESGSLPQN